MKNVKVNKKINKGILILEVIKLGSMGRSISQISDMVRVPRSTLHGWYQRITELNLSYELAKEMSEQQLVEVMFPRTPVGRCLRCRDGIKSTLEWVYPA